MMAEVPHDDRAEHDLEQRRRAIEETHRSFVVEASAGTGKTTTLIRRILHLVLEKGPEGQPVRLSRICAITFTEKAAGEMKIRLRQGLEEVLFDDRASAARVDRAREALNDLETASISTFHSFAVSLLKERPIEARLDPYFTPLDEVRSELFFREVWESWISRALAERRPVLEKALRKRIDLETIQDLARTLRLNQHAVRSLHCDSPPGEDETQAAADQLLQQGRRFAELSINSKDKLFDHLGRSLDWLTSPRQDCEEPSKPGHAGIATNWTGGKETVTAVQNFVKDVAEFCESCKKLPSQHLLNDLICFLREEFLMEWESRKRAAGFVDFDDQLWLALQLLINSRAVRKEFQDRYDTLLVDEFQDTDQIQWHIVLLLASTALDVTDFAQLRPGPGRLFIVGDPKQSIYRFRTADIETYLKIVEPPSMKALGMERLELTTNFRSVPSILRFADDAFPGVMTESAYQPAYLPFGGHGARPAESDSHMVYILGDRKDGDAVQTALESVKAEAAQIVGLIKLICGSDSWKVEDPYEPKSGRRVPRFGDMAVLMPVLSRADILEDALRDAGIPYVLEGGKFYYTRSEVSSAITVLRAIANPNDAVALYGSLRSIYFGFSDQDLLRFQSVGECFDYRRQISPESPFHHAFEILFDLHQHRHERTASETLEILLQRTGAREALVAHGLQSLANLNKLARTLRSLQGESTFSHVVDLLSTMDEERLAESESRLMEEKSDAVRIMSIHKSKGLDFPIVFVAGLGQKRLTKYKSMFADFHQKKIYSLRIGYRESVLQSPRWKELAEAEKKREDAELVRLLYVALTRPRDHLVICAHTPKSKWIEAIKQWVPETGGTRLDPLETILADSRSGMTKSCRWLEPDEKAFPSTHPSQGDLLPGMNDWIRMLDSDYRQLHSIVDKTPSARVLQTAADEADSALEDRIPESARERAIRLGVAFHEAMEKADFSRLDLLSQDARAIGTRHNLDRESIENLGQMIRTSLSSGLLERARTAAQSGGRIMREIPFVRPLGEGIEEGKIDLLFEESGGWILVDYKTDQVPSDPDRLDEYFQGKYSGQIREYLEALRCLPIKVQSAYLLLARTGHAVKMPTELRP